MAEAQTTTTNLNGSTASTQTTIDDSLSYTGWQMAAGGAGEFNKWIQERQAQSWDAIYVAPGATVGIDVQREIAIDYDPNGRKIVHAHHSLLPGQAHLD